MAHRSKIMWWQCVENEAFGYRSRRWIIYDGPPEDEKSEIYHELDEKDYRPFIKGLPKFEPGKVFTGRMTFTPATPRKRKKKDEEQE